MRFLRGPQTKSCGRCGLKQEVSVKVLLVDDEEYLLSAVERVLIELGHTVDCISNAEKAIEMIETGGYDFAFIDYMMPIHDGIWFMKKARIPRTTKVLLMTGYIDREIITTMFKLGARGYLIKPIEKEEIEHHIAFHSGNRPGADSAPNV